MTAQTLSYCERVTATPMSPVHIRTVGPEGRKLGGGIPGPALCGAEVRNGWDLPTDVPTTLDQYAAIPQDRPGRMCLRCVDAAVSTP